ncbi:NAD(P)-binding protein [Lojkania enalia]|uniref:NAD(P)-binding protein n=1 Tax=Lojkania enalia TaxID=147567 RepID=A0A9P4MZI2_9PLEO|nr:NAD(P)-binding protein [Didymosphaeria enalia]
MPILALQPGSTVFVTGVNGLIGSHVADQLLARGYNVVGAVRDAKKNEWLAEYFAGKHHDAKFSLVTVLDITVEGCYDDLVKGCDAVMHVATVMPGPDPKTLIPSAITGSVNALTAAVKEPRIKRVVLTSSSVAAVWPNQEVKITIDQGTFNETAIKSFWDDSDKIDPMMKIFLAYTAIKTETEKACWEFVKKSNPGFVFNTVCPNVNFGEVLLPEKQGCPSTVHWAKTAYTGGPEFDISKKIIPPQWYIDTVDCALLHVGALIYDEVRNERLFGFARRFNWKDLVSIYKKIYPDKTFPEAPEGEDLTEVPNQRAEEVLSWVKGSGWKSLEDSVREMMPAIVGGTEGAGEARIRSELGMEK